MGEIVAGVLVAGWLAALSAFDIRARRLPNWLTLPGAVVVLGAAVAAGRGWPAAAGAAALAGLYLVVHLGSPAALGAGDVKLAIGLGALTGAFGTPVWTLAALAAPLGTALWGLAVLVRPAGRSPAATVPHGPAMCLASAAAVALVIV
ncbi:A24 family peptidase [Mycobacterium sp. MYCO198283]|uniref:prepilin peptidase n=1 Tax=Mycobacterium sp. MYCO198283 TaxID=2883505 RepID=UPI001E434276|nr:A24 family peptidase [Mycobacterium sp. MYCO198283]MCG5433635.1 A24 family peptidase [Mycobacterium sp. MYCO198283]